MTFANILIFLSNLLNLLSMLTKNQLYMRMLNACANIFLMIYCIFFINIDQQINFMFWRIIFFIIQIFQIVRLYKSTHIKSE